jgi:nicotinate-nucleotide adenylyltransferase
MADLAERMASARRVVSRHPRVHVTDLERRIGTRYSVDTVRWLTRHGRAKFVWLMGADNLAQLPRWRHWRRLMALVPIAVFDREPYSHWVVAGRVATAYAARRLADGSACVLADRSPPAWVYLRLRRHQESSTAIRRADAAGGRAAHEEEERP